MKPRCGKAFQKTPKNMPLSILTLRKKLPGRSVVFHARAWAPYFALIYVKARKNADTARPARGNATKRFG
jgi:hypothetical protein